MFALNRFPISRQAKKSIFCEISRAGYTFEELIQGHFSKSHILKAYDAGNNSILMFVITVIYGYIQRFLTTNGDV